MKRITKSALATLLGVGLILSATACSAPAAGDGATRSVDVNTQVAGQLETAGVAADPGSLTCAGELAAKVGESVSCDFSSDGQPVGLVASVVKAEGSDVDVKVETQARPIPKDVLEYEVGQRVGRELGVAVTAGCDGDLQSEPKASTGCTLSAGEATRKVQVTVTAVTGGLVEYAIDAS